MGCTKTLQGRDRACLWWHCRNCGDHALAEPPAELGDKEKCITCYAGFAEVMTLRDAARLEQARALDGGRDASGVGGGE